MPAGTAVRHAAPSGRAPEAAPARPPDRRGPGLITFARGRWLRTIPGRIRAFVVVILIAIVALLAVLAAAIGNARDSVQTIGHDAGPQVVATGTLFSALSDMDAQVASVLLIGREHDLGIGHDGALGVYERRRSEAGAAAVQAAQLAGRDPHLRQRVQAVIDGLGRYERLVGEAMVLDRQSAHAAGEPPKQVVDTYRRATDLMRLELLPQAYNLTLDSGAAVRQTYETKRTAVLTGRAWVALTGVLVLLLLLAAQVYLARGFRRLVNPALALATVAALALVGAGFAELSAQAGHIKKAKMYGFDSVLALSRARAISNSAFADESRYLLDPGKADTYEQTYLDKSLAVIYPDLGDKPVNLESYYAGLEQQAGSYRPGKGDAPFLGFFGDEASTVRPGREADALGRTLQAYRAVQRNDQRIRQLAGSGDRTGAIKLRMDRDRTIRDFNAYDAALRSLTALHQGAFDSAIEAGDGGLRAWRVLPPAAALVIAALTVAGVRPRLAEFR
ncbi:MULTISPECIES: hypothetical protein [Thermomonosporaceae]|uniref:hypothetical protein n=1 Tax=Thermomonosporaceae TaxID=2012 RepID=UPI00255ADB7B|nr:MULTISPECIES: hypothetical protein [Thermomonosporaceae]MDL4773675.1 hypothetical protein [Actinomadura xylanilytica]